MIGLMLVVESNSPEDEILLRSVAICCGCDTDKAAIGTSLWKNDRSSTLISLLTGGTAISLAASVLILAIEHILVKL